LPWGESEEALGVVAIPKELRHTSDAVIIRIRMASNPRVDLKTRQSTGLVYLDDLASRRV
jgi:hypothetical protein